MRIRILSLAAVFLILATSLGIAQPYRDRGENDRAYFTPVYLSLVPGLSFPFGSWDVLVAAGAVGAAVHDVDGLMGSGVFNLSNNIRGAQGAGVFNIAGEVRGLQAAGVFNLSGDLVGAQSAGVFNMAGEVRGVQAAGVFNMAKDIDGVQVAGVVNVAGRVSGVQLGVVNVADELDGFQIGLVNIAKDGVNGLGLLYEPQSDYSWAYWQNGSRYLYTILGAGLPTGNLGSSPMGLVVAAGLGSRFGGRGHGYAPWLDVEILAAQEIGAELQAMYEAERAGLAWSGSFAPSWPELRLRLGLPLSHRLALVGGFVMDIDVGGASGLPTGLKTGWRRDSSFFDANFTTYTRWYLGLKF